MLRLDVYLDDDGDAQRLAHFLKGHFPGLRIDWWYDEFIDPIEYGVKIEDIPEEMWREVLVTAAFVTVSRAGVMLQLRCQ